MKLLSMMAWVSFIISCVIFFAIAFFERYVRLLCTSHDSNDQYIFSHKNSIQ